MYFCSTALLAARAGSWAAICSGASRGEVAHSPMNTCFDNQFINLCNAFEGFFIHARDNFPDGKRFRSYPSIKIGRFAVSKDYRGHQIGSELLSTIKYLLGKAQNLSAFRFITVDAYLSAIPFTKRTVSGF